MGCSVESALPTLRILCQKQPPPKEAFRALRIPQRRAYCLGNATLLPRWLIQPNQEIVLLLSSLQEPNPVNDQDRGFLGNVPLQKPKQL